ncbi:MAG: ribosome-associated translation inhibitor RaiA [Pseudolabrys sp.]|nr:ribosome-associated translation inhibitor RaiA [Pseudolabrys sp.]MBV9260653.1 ribosome-associated translation inhibitor RaiA [Pseudolabrys sp.]
MPFRISGKNLDVGPALRKRISARIDEATEKYFEGGGYSGRATINKDGFGFRTECEIHLDSGRILEAEGMDADPYLSADKAAVRIETQLRRYNRRLKDRSGAKVRRKMKAISEAS